MDTTSPTDPARTPPRRRWSRRWDLIGAAVLLVAGLGWVALRPGIARSVIGSPQALAILAVALVAGVAAGLVIWRRSARPLVSRTVAALPLLAVFLWSEILPAIVGPVTAADADPIAAAAAVAGEPSGPGAPVGGGSITVVAPPSTDGSAATSTGPRSSATSTPRSTRSSPTTHRSPTTRSSRPAPPAARSSARPATRPSARVPPTVRIPPTAAPATAPAPSPPAPTAPAPSPPAPTAPAPSPPAPTAPAPTAPAVTPVEPIVPRLLGTGPLTGIDHDASGTVEVIDVDGGSVVRFEDFSVEPGPDYVLYVVPGADATSPGGRSLGALPATRGALNVPIDDVAAGTEAVTVLIWCRAYAVPVAAATVHLA